MTISRADVLKAEPIEAIRAAIEQHQANWHPAEKKPDLIKRLMLLEANAANQGADETKPAKPKYPRLSVAEVKKAIQPFLDRGLKAKFSADGERWHFIFDTKRFAKVGPDDYQPIIKEDSGSMTQPIKVIVNCAQHLIKNVVQKKTVSASDIMRDFEADDEAA